MSEEVEIVIRPAQPQDAAVLGEIRVDAYIRAGLTTMDSPYLPNIRDVASEIDDPNTYVFAATVDGVPVGTTTMVGSASDKAMVARDGEWEARLTCVDENFSRMGVGWRLMIRLIVQAVELEIPAVVGCIAPFNKAMANGLEQAGATRTPERDFASPDGYTLHTYVMDRARMKEIHDLATAN